jgi:hypothetical protein
MMVVNFTLKDQIETLSLTKGARVLSVGTLFGKITIWVQMDLDGEKERRLFGMWNTGREILAPLKGFIGTVVVKNVAFHVYELEHG